MEDESGLVATHFWHQSYWGLLNIGCVVLVSNETNTDVHMYIEEFILVDVITLLYKLEVKIWIEILTGLYTNATIDMSRLSDVFTRKDDNCSWQE